MWFPIALPAEMTTLSYSLVKSESEKSRADPTARFAGPYNGSHLKKEEEEREFQRSEMETKKYRQHLTHTHKH